MKHAFKYFLLYLCLLSTFNNDVYASNENVMRKLTISDQLSNYLVNNYKPDTLLSALGSKIKIATNVYSIVGVTKNDIVYEDTSYVKVNLTIQKNSDKNLVMYTVVLRPKNHVLEPIDGELQSLIILANPSYLGPDYFVPHGIKLYTGDFFPYINKYLRFGEIINTPQSLKDFNAEFLKLLIEYRAHKLYDSSKIEIKETQKRYDNYLAELKKSKGVLNSNLSYLGNLYLSSIVNIISKSFMAEKNQYEFFALYRGMGKNSLKYVFPNNPKDANGLPIINEGDETAADMAFMSTSKVRKVAVQFAGSNAAIFKIIPSPTKKTPALSVEDFSKYPKEQEVLLPPGMKFKVIKIDHLDSGKTIELTVMPI